MRLSWLSRSSVRSLLIPALVVGLCGSAAVAGSDRHAPADALVSGVFSELAADEFSCMADEFGPFALRVSRCGKIEGLDKKSVEAFKQTIDELLAGYTSPLEPWKREGRDRKRRFAVDDIVLVVTLKPGRRRLSISYPKQFEHCPKRTSQGIPGFGDVSNPKLIERSDPRYPELALTARMDGAVVLQAVVKSDGSVGDICPLICDRPRAGFVEAAIEAVSKWRYEPAMRGDQPIDVDFLIIVTFQVNVSRRLR